MCLCAYMCVYGHGHEKVSKKCDINMKISNTFFDKNFVHNKIQNKKQNKI